VLLTPARDASAHAGYESSTPADGETLADSPPEVEVIFSQEMARSGGLPSLVVVNDSGDQVDLGAELDDADRTRMVAPLAPSLPEGRYTVIWHTLSDEDGEEANGAFHFFVGQPPAQDTPGPATTVPGKGTPQVSATAAPTAPPSAEDNGDDGAPIWLLVAGILAALAIGIGAGILVARRSAA
jgi:methionine-rich copper-binding protein CopC